MTHKSAKHRITELVLIFGDPVATGHGSILSLVSGLHFIVGSPVANRLRMSPFAFNI